MAAVEEPGKELTACSIRHGLIWQKMELLNTLYMCSVCYPPSAYMGISWRNQCQRARLAIDSA